MEENKLKAKIEAALFLTENPLKATAVAKIVQEDVDKVRQTILELIRDYEERNLGLEISDDGGYIIQVKDEFATLIDEFVPLEIPTSLIRTLSAIAIKQPVMQSEIIKIRGAGAYEHIKELMERELVNKKEEGRSPTLTTTKKFQEYFRLSKDGKSLRQVLIREHKEKEEAEAEAEAKEQAALEGTTFDATPEPGGPSISGEVEQQTLNLGESIEIPKPGSDKYDNQTEQSEDSTSGPISRSEEESTETETTELSEQGSPESDKQNLPDEEQDKRQDLDEVELKAVSTHDSSEEVDSDTDESKTEEDIDPKDSSETEQDLNVSMADSETVVDTRAVNDVSNNAI